jgi:group I intron endonuclease
VAAAPASAAPVTRAARAVPALTDMAYVRAGRAGFAFRSIHGYEDLPKPQDGVCFVYLITNHLTGARYVGVSVDPKARLRNHKRDRYPIGNALRRYGPTAFSVTVILSAGEYDCYFAEKRFIDALGTLTSQGGYNLHEGGCSPPRMLGSAHPAFGKPMSQVVREKLRLANLGKHQSEETKALRSLYRPTEETRRKLRAARAAQPPYTAERRRAMSERRQQFMADGVGKVAKLNPESVMEIRLSADKASALAARFQVSRRAVQDVRNGKTWAWLK